MRNAEKVGWTARKPKKPFVEMLNAIGDSLSDLQLLHTEQDGEDEEDNAGDRKLVKLSKNDQPSQVIGKISKKLLQPMESCRKKDMKLYELTQPDAGMRPTTSMKWIYSMRQQNSIFLQLSNRKPKKLLLCLGRQHLGSVWRYLISLPENCKYCN